MDKYRKDKLRKKTKGTKSTDKETLDQDVSDDDEETTVDGNKNGGVTGAEGTEESSDDEVSTGSEGVGDKRTRERGSKTRHLKLVRGYS